MLRLKPAPSNKDPEQLEKKAVSFLSQKILSNAEYTFINKSYFFSPLNREEAQ